ncbi:MAG: Gfo/Idh/MocA family oxidoreductase [Phaeodactylibacter sp.]|nr:Gfo/Idh/MocA family oxidoreductase [Phaeodactylibacter sp.]MCB9292503.1 Gfo/Idh/MocA family oxidoreductase [Lewinellaceae bacterium]
MAKTYNWGIIGLGKIAHKFAQDLDTLPNARLQAVASRSEERAREFALQYGAPHAFGSYEEITACPGLDVVYIATPHPGHRDNTVMCLNAGIPVLCEKPFAMNSRQVREMVAAARASDTFLMEAIWTRFNPSTAKALELIGHGMIGDVLSVKADFGFRPLFDPDSRLFNHALGGGSLLDIGIYPVFLALLLLGKPAGIQAMAHIGATGVDEEVGMLFQYQNGQMAHLHASLRAFTKTEAFIYGERGAIHLHTRWHEPTSLSLILEDRRPQDYRFEYTTNGYSYEAEEVMHCLEHGLKESPLLPLSFSQDLMEVLDRVREIIGLQYPEDETG